MRRIVNLRAMLVVALHEILLILSLYAYYVWHSTGFTLLIAYFVVLTAELSLSYIYRKTKLLTAFFISLLFAIFTCVSFIVQEHNFHTLTPVADRVYTVNGTVDTVAAQYDAVQYVTLQNVKIDGKRVKGKVQICFSEDDIYERDMPVGCYVETSGALYAVLLLDGKAVNGTAYRQNVRYKLYAAHADTTVLPRRGSLFVRTRVALYRRLRSACGDTYGSIAYCMLTGDKSELDATTANLYSVSGIGHILAVSGLHVGILVGVLLFLFRRLRLPRVVQICCICGLLLLYAAFVGFTASVLRASIMCAIAMFTWLNGERYDALNTMSLAFAVLLVFEPFLLFEVGFLLTFTAVFGLILFSPAISSALRRIRCPAFLASPLSATLSVHIGILPVTAYFFGAVQTYSVFFNLLIVPLLSVTFIFFVLTAPLCTLLHFDFLLRLGGLGYAVTDMFVHAVTFLPANSIYVNGHVGLFLLYPLYFAASRFFLVPATTKYKTAVSGGIAAVCLSLVCVPTLTTLQPSADLRYGLLPVDSYGDVTTVVYDDAVTVIGDCKNTAALKATLRQYRIRKIDTIVLHALTAEVGKSLAEFARDNRVGKIVCPADRSNNDGLAVLAKYADVYDLSDVNLPHITPVLSENKRHVGYTYRFSEAVSVFFAGYSARYTDMPAEVLNATPVIRCFMYLNAYADRVYVTNMPKGYLGQSPTYQYSLADLGGFTYKVLNGTVKKR